LRQLIRPIAALLAGVALSAALAYAAAPKNLDRAIDAQRALLAERPADSTLENDLGSLLVLGDDLEGAAEAYRRAIALDETNASAHYNLGLVLQKQGERRDALKQFKRTLELEPRHAWARYQEGTIYHHQGRESAARKAYAKAIALDPELGNPAVNPHIIDNELATSAMLYSYRHYRAELLPETGFEEPARIARVMIDRPGSEADAVATTHSERETPGGLVRSSGQAAAEKSAASDSSEIDPGATKGEPSDDPAPEARVLTSRDLDPGRASNQVVGGGVPGRSSSATGGRNVTSNKGRARDVQAPSRPTLRTPVSGGEPQPPSAPPSFLPTSDSTGMIEVRLVEIDELT
jgi:hypothetical protein